jgi:hypothetical protein
MSATITTVTIGDVFCRSWGYEQTQVDYYEIVRVSASGKTAKARQLRTVTASPIAGSARSELVTAATGADRFVTDARCSRCSNRHRGEPGWDGHQFSDEYNWQARTNRITVDYDHAYPWDGQPDYQTGYGSGH